MTGEQHSDVANLGLVRPPLVYLVSIILGLLLRVFRDARVLPHSISMAAGVILTLAAVVLFVAAVRTFRKANTPVPGNRPTTTIVRSGPYRFSRNPIYLAFTVFQIGLALLLNSLAMALTLLPALALMARVVIPREERYLEVRFPMEYPSYKRTVRRWL